MPIIHPGRLSPWLALSLLIAWPGRAPVSSAGVIAAVDARLEPVAPATNDQPSATHPRSDLDDLMARVLARRDENWKKLQQYVLDEREFIEVLAPGRVRLYGLERDYTWFIREGYFIRSPVRFDGVEIGDADRRKYEQEWIARERERESRRAKEGEPVDPGTSADEAPANIGDVLRQTAEPRFVSAAYFLRFRFEPGRYALVGRETLDGNDVLRIEYYPTRLFEDEKNEEQTSDRPARKSRRKEKDENEEDRLGRQMNKVALITLWVEPQAQQVVQYTFSNVGFDFLPGRSLVRVDDVEATMRMGQPFPGVWLPRDITGRVTMTFAPGTFEAHFNVDYRNYKQADVKVQIR